MKKLNYRISKKKKKKRFFSSNRQGTAAELLPQWMRSYKHTEQIQVWLWNRTKTHLENQKSNCNALKWFHLNLFLKVGKDMQKHKAFLCRELNSDSSVVQRVHLGHNMNISKSNPKASKDRSVINLVLKAPSGPLWTLVFSPGPRYVWEIYLTSTGHRKMLLREKAPGTIRPQTQPQLLCG